METSSEENSPMSDFKVPSLPFKSPASKAETTKTLSEDQKVPELESEDTASDSKEEVTVDREAPAAPEAPEVPPVSPSVPGVQYDEPSWGGSPPSDKLYSLEILKNGIIVDNVKLSGKSYFTVGR